MYILDNQVVSNKKLPKWVMFGKRCQRKAPFPSQILSKSFSRESTVDPGLECA